MEAIIDPKDGTVIAVVEDGHPWSKTERKTFKIVPGWNDPAIDTSKAPAIEPYHVYAKDGVTLLGKTAVLDVARYDSIGGGAGDWASVSTCVTREIIDVKSPPTPKGDGKGK